MALSRHTATADDDPEAAASPDLRHDPWLAPTSPTLGELAAAVFMETEALRPTTSRAPRADALRRRRTIIGNLVANLAVAALMAGPDDAGTHIAIETANAKLTRYDRQDFPRQAIGDAIGGLEAAGLLVRQAGVHRRTTTTIVPSPALRQRLEAAGVTMADIGRDRGGEAIILKARSATRREPKQLIDYADTPETRRLRGEMQRINDYLRAADITVEGQPPPPLLLTRHYLMADPDSPPRFTLHGRIYGGFWINMERGQRHRIRIGGEPCADCDFSGMMVRLAYHHAKAALPEGDPYDGIEGLPLDPISDPEGGRRDAVKQVVSSLLSRTGAMVQLPPGIGAVLGPDWTAARFMSAVSRRHAPIARLFGRGIGLRLMHTESRILVRLLLDLINLGVPALPIHDGIMVPASGEGLAVQAMRQASAAVLGVELPVKSQVLIPP